MARAERQVPTIYLGRPGSLDAFPWPRGDVEKTYLRQGYDFLTGSGQHAVSLLSGGARDYTLHWNALHVDNFNLLDAYWTGANGVGPWAVIDPSVPNLLLPNQAAAGGATYDATGWKTNSGLTNEGTLSANSTSTFIHRARGQRSLRWQFTTSPVSFPLLTVTAPYRNWPGIPVAAGLPYAYSAWVRPDGTVDSSITMALKIRWLDVSGGTISETTSGDTVVTTWTRLTATATAPAGAAYALPLLIVTGSTVITGGSVYLDEPLFEQDSVANTWAPGTGVRAVEIISLTDLVTFETRMRRGIDMNLQELAI